MKPTLLQSTSCVVVDYISNVNLPWFIIVPLIRIYAALYGANLEEASKPISEYKTFNEFFTRELKPDSRKIEGKIVSPIDGALVDSGDAATGTSVKGKMLDISLLLNDNSLYSELKGGKYLNYYLAPGDYHRVHAPISGEVVKIDVIPGALYSVKPKEFGNSVLPINKRVVIELKTSIGTVAVVLIGALNVGRIELPSSVKEGLRIEAGSHIGTFFLGSSVVLVFPSGTNIKSEKVPRKVFMGEDLEG